MRGEQRDFFISYNKADHDWAVWIAHTLENAGYTTVLEAWDFRPGQNFAVEMQNALTRSDRVIAVLSPDYFRGEFAFAEWASAFGDDPTGARGRLVPVMVRECAPQGLLSTIIHISLVGLEQTAAGSRLLGGLAAGRTKPLTVPSFPGAVTPEAEPEPPRTTSTTTWTPLDTPPKVTWRVDATGADRAGGPLLEAHLLPVPATSMPVRELSALGDRLVSTGRAMGLFSQAQAVSIKSGTGHVTAFVGSTRIGPGLLATRTGQRGGWAPLPGDTFGAVLDEADVAIRLVGLLTTLAAVDPLPAEIAIAVGVEPADFLVLGSAADVGRRSSAEFPSVRAPLVRWEPTDTVPSARLGTHGEEIAAELAARIVGRFTESR
ncbi:toll/interleukin-1 receptor domain-containing protein [Actinokineospora sp. 24-640]